MSYDPSHRRLPPRQGGWPQATPPRAWPAHRDDSAHWDADQASGQDEATGQGSYWDDGSSPPQSANQGQSAYQRELAYQGHAAYRGQPGYQAQPPYEPQPTYQGQPAYEPRPAYQGAPAYQAQPTYQDQPTYQGQPAAYQDQPTYGAQPAYGAQPDYQAEPGYQHAFDGSADHEYRDYQQTRVIDPFPAAPDGYAYGRGGHDARNAVTGDYGEPADGFDGGGNGYGVVTDGFDGAGNGYGEPADGFDGYADAEDGYGAPEAYADQGNANGWSGNGYQDASRGDYGLGAGSMLTAPDAGLLPHHWQADRDRRREERRRGPMVGAVTGFLAAAVAIGVTILAAAFVRPQVSPIVAVGNVFIDRTPTSLKNLAVTHFGQHGRTVLLLGMYVIIALLATALGVLTRRAPALGVASIAAGAVLAAFVTITRSQGGPRDAIPWVIGGMAGVAALLWLVRSSAPVTPVRPARGGNRRRT